MADSFFVCIQFSCSSKLNAEENRMHTTNNKLHSDALRLRNKCDNSVAFFVFLSIFLFGLFKALINLFRETNIKISQSPYASSASCIICERERVFVHTHILYVYFYCMQKRDLCILRFAFMPCTFSQKRFLIQQLNTFISINLIAFRWCCCCCWLT